MFDDKSVELTLQLNLLTINLLLTNSFNTYVTQQQISINM